MRLMSKVAAVVAVALSVTAGVAPAQAIERATWGYGDISSRFLPMGSAPWAPTSQNTFYDVPATLPAGSGQTVKTLPGTVFVDPNKVISGSASGTRIMYTTESSRGEQVAATAVALRSEARWRGAGERPLVVLAPGTQGLGDHCAPTNQLNNGTEYEIFAISVLLAKGYNVTVIDYIGGGTEGTLSYLNRIDQGHAVLDAARASTNGSVNFVSKDAPVGVWGYSQGGGAAAAAGELHAEYAPDVNLKGIFAGAVPADLQQVINTIDGTHYNGFALMSIAGLGDSYGVDLKKYLSHRGVQAIEATRNSCTFDAIREFGALSTIPAGLILWIRYSAVLALHMIAGW